MVGQVVVVREGLIVDGHAYQVGDLVQAHHLAHDVVEAASGRPSSLRGWVVRFDEAPLGPPEPEPSDSEPIVDEPHHEAQDEPGEA